MSQTFLTLIILLAAYLVNISIHKLLNRIGELKKVPKHRIIYLNKFISIITIFITFLLISLVFSIDYKGLLVFASSVFAVVGVALFAQWSILSNVTASIIIFFTFPARIGDMIKIIDGDNSVEGEIVEITLFQIEILSENGDKALYPNNLLLQKPVVKKNSKNNLENKTDSLESSQL